MGFMDPTPLFVGLPAVIALVAITRMVSENRTRRLAIEARLSEEKMRAMFARDPDAYGALKWGLVCCAVGLAIVLSTVLELDLTQPVVYGMMLLFGGGALLLYYRLALKAVEREAQERQSRSRAFEAAARAWPAEPEVPPDA
jgi:hypothetical protein